ncbi:MAG: c-type cytochrome [Nitrosomonas sp.]|nr:c-type cytochrome [Nitrosomonas sp.]
MAAASALLLATGVHADADLAKNSGCLNCHTVETKLVGPSLKEIAAKYAGQDNASDYLADKIKNGSNGVWGPVPMPPNAMVSDDNAKVLADFILSLN